MLEAGSNDSYCANILSELGFEVIGVDLRPYGECVYPLTLPCNYRFLQGDVTQLELPPGYFDLVYSLSAVEHFGLGTYGENPSEDADMVAMRVFHDLMAPKGLTVITVPYTREYEVHGSDWRVYDRKNLEKRLCQGFEVADKEFFVSRPINVPGFYYEEGESLSPLEADMAPPFPPHVTVLLTLRSAIVGA